LREYVEGVEVIVLYKWHCLVASELASEVVRCEIAFGGHRRRWFGRGAVEVLHNVSKILVRADEE
jgi:hypothetical protein